jgi:hypothetical protein
MPSIQLHPPLQPPTQGMPAARGRLEQRQVLGLPRGQRRSTRPARSQRSDHRSRAAHVVRIRVGDHQAVDPPSRPGRQVRHHSGGPGIVAARAIPRPPAASGPPVTGARWRRPALRPSRGSRSRSPAGRSGATSTTATATQPPTPGPGPGPRARLARRMARGHRAGQHQRGHGLYRHRAERGSTRPPWPSGRAASRRSRAPPARNRPAGARRYRPPAPGPGRVRRR